LTELARRADTSAPALHRYESGWDRFELATLRRIASALGASLSIQLRPRRTEAAASAPTESELIRLISPLFWDKKLTASDLSEYPGWVLGRILSLGGRREVDAGRLFFGDQAIRKAIRRRGIDPRTRAYWSLMLARPEPG